MIDSTSVPPKEDSEPVIIRHITIVIVALLLAACAADPSTTSPGSTSADSDGSSQASNEDPKGTPESGDEDSAQADTNSSDDTASEEPDDEKNPDDEKPKKRERIVLKTVYDDQKVGEDQRSVVEAEFGLIDDEKLANYVRSVGLRLVRHAPPRPFDYEFKVVDQSAPNAFALPGGKIYISRGLLALVETEDELAGVLGHEITHAAERHAAGRIDYSSRLNPFSIGLLRAAAIAAYGRDQERDADRGGQIIASKAGYNPAGIATFLRKLDASDRYEIGWSRLPYFLATHPTSPNRSALTADRAAGLKWERQPGVADDLPFGYYSMIDGLIIGDNPAGGLFEETRFVHPDLRFSIRFPQGWMTMNSQQAVAAISPARDAEATLTVVGNGTDLNKVVDEFIKKEVDGIRVRVRARKEVKLGELPAIRIEGRASSGLTGLNVQMTFVAHEGLIYRLSLLSLSNAADKYRGRARAFAHSFRPLDGEGVYSLQVTRLRIARALENETLTDLDLRTRNEIELVYTGVMNDLYATSALAKGTPVKIGLAEPYLPIPKTESESDSGEPSEGEGTPAREEAESLEADGP
jgi:predicted Zn-dependent protease